MPLEGARRLLPRECVAANGNALIRSANKSARKRVVGEDNKCIANLKIIGGVLLAHGTADRANVQLLNRSDSGRSFHGGLKSLLEPGVSLPGRADGPP